MEKEKLLLNLATHWQDCQEAGFHPIYLALYGSQNYDLATPESDVDSKAIVLPSLEDILRNRPMVSTTIFHKDGSLTDVKDIRLMFAAFKKQNVNFLEILFTEYWVCDQFYEEEVKKLREQAELIAHFCNHAAWNCMKGMALEKHKALCHPYPTIKWKIDKWGYDGKQLSHILRMHDFLTRFAEGESYRDCLISDPESRRMQLAAKRQEFTLEDAKATADYYVEKTSVFLASKMETAPLCVDETASNFLDDLSAEVLTKKIKQELK